MLSHYEALTRIKAAKLVAILRHVPTEKLDGVVEALMAGGVRVLEFTFDHDRADCVKENAEKIRHTVEKYGDRVLVGCGTALFPAGTLGVSYIKAVRGPLAYIDMSAVGGVKPENVAEFLDAGVCGFGVGGQLVLPDAVKTGDFAAIQARAKAFTDAIAQWEAAKCS